MEALLEPVVEVFPEFNFEMQTPPSYVQFYNKSLQEIVFVYIKNKQSALSTSFDDDNKGPKEVLELTGSPLKLDLSLHTILDETLALDVPQLWLREELSHTPIAIEKARKVANLYNEVLQEHEQDQSIPMWILCDPRGKGQPLLLTVQSFKDNFRRGIVSYEGYISMQDFDVDKLVQEYTELALVPDDLVNVSIDCKYLIAGMSYSNDTSKTMEELVNAPHDGSTNLLCEWTSRCIQTPVITCKTNLVQEVIVGHLTSPCHSMWKSICALYSINHLLVDMTAAGYAAMDLDNAPIRKNHITLKPFDNSKRLKDLLKEVEIYTYMVKRQKGGCICITEDSKTLKQCLDAMESGGSSNDFTYKLWDILKDCETAEELITLLIQALKVLSSGKMKPYTSKVLKNLRTNPPQALSLVGQVGIEKCMWEYTQLMSLVEHSFFIAGIWTSEVTSNTSIEQINQTINDMTLGGDYTLNPFENKSPAETSIRFDSESFFEDDTHELTVDDFASLKKLGLVGEKKTTNEVPLIVDEIDISTWKNLLMKFAQVHCCLEHLNRAQQCLRADFANLKPVATRLREHYVSERSPIKTVGQLMNDPIHKITMPIDNNVVKDQLEKKQAFWYRLSLQSNGKTSEKTLHRDISVTHTLTQQHVFSPTVSQYLEQQYVEATEATMVAVDVKYHATKYTFLTNQFAGKS